MAFPPFSLSSTPLLFTLLQLTVLPLVFGGAYYGHKPHPQHHQPLPHLAHMGMGKEGLPQQQYLGKDMHHMQYPQYRKELPQMPIHMGKENPRKGGMNGGGQDKGETGLT